MKIHELMIATGEDIRDKIEKYVISHGWNEVYVSGAIGSVIDISVTTPVENKLPLHVSKTPISGAAELLSMSGEIMKREKMDSALRAVYPDKTSPLFVHLHVCVATAGGHVSGGGLTDGKAFRALRVFLIPLDSYVKEGYKDEK